MANAKYVVVKQLKRSPFTVVEVVEYEVRDDAREEARTKNRAARSYKYKVLPLKPGKIRRAAGMLKGLLRDINATV